MEIRRKSAGGALMAAGLVCGIIYILTNLYGPSLTGTQVSQGFLYVGIVAITSGLIFYLIGGRRP